MSPLSKFSRRVRRFFTVLSDDQSRRSWRMSAAAPNLAVKPGILRSSINARRADYCTYISAPTIFQLFMQLFSVVSRNIDREQWMSDTSAERGRTRLHIRQRGHRCLDAVRTMTRPGAAR
jgi:hypothetical protein